MTTKVIMPRRQVLATATASAVFAPFVWVPDAAAQAGATVQDQNRQSIRTARDFFKSRRTGTRAADLNRNGSIQGIETSGLAVGASFMPSQGFPIPDDSVNIIGDDSAEDTMKDPDDLEYCKNTCRKGYIQTAKFDGSVQQFVNTNNTALMEGPALFGTAAVARDLEPIVRQSSFASTKVEIETRKQFLFPSRAERRTPLRNNNKDPNWEKRPVDVYFSDVARITLAYRRVDMFKAECFYRVQWVDGAAIGDTVTEGLVPFAIYG